jgi:hypothetical protein
MELKTLIMAGIFVATAKIPFDPMPKKMAIMYLFAKFTNHLLSTFGMSGKEKCKLSFNICGLNSPPKIILGNFNEKN